MTHWKSWEQNLFSQFSWGFLYFPQFLRFSDGVVVKMFVNVHMSFWEGLFIYFQSC